MKIAKLKIENYGFTLIELLVVIFIMAMLTTIVMINFQAQRQSQEIAAAGSDMLSKIREVQSNLLGGKIPPGAAAAASAYEVTFTSGSASYAVDYFIGSTRTNLETAATLQNTRVKQIYVGGLPKAQTVIRLAAPYGAITADGAANQTVRLDLEHLKSGQIRSLVIDGVSGRIGAQ